MNIFLKLFVSIDLPPTFFISSSAWGLPKLCINADYLISQYIQSNFRGKIREFQKFSLKIKKNHKYCNFSLSF